MFPDKRPTHIEVTKKTFDSMGRTDYGVFYNGKFFPKLWPSEENIREDWEVQNDDQLIKSVNNQLEINNGFYIDWEKVNIELEKNNIYTFYKSKTIKSRWLIIGKKLEHPYHLYI